MPLREQERLRTLHWKDVVFGSMEAEEDQH